MICPKCQHSNVEGAKFCSECGNKLIDSEHLCPFCHSKVNYPDKYCSSCGGRLLWPSQNGPRQVTTSNNFHININIRKVIAGLIISIAIILLIVGLFGAIGKANYSSNGSNMSSTTNFTYFFGEGFKSLNETKDIYPYPEYYNVSLFMFIINTISYFSLLLSIPLFVIIDFIRYLKIKIFDYKFIRYIFLISIVHLCILFSRILLVSQESGVHIYISLSWGSILLIIGTPILLAGLFLDRVIANENKSPSIILKYSFYALAILTTLLFFSKIYSLLIDASAYMDASLYNVTLLAITEYSTGSAVNELPGLVISLVIEYIGLATLIASIILLANNKFKSFFILTSISAVSLLTSFFMTLGIANSYVKDHISTFMSANVTVEGVFAIIFLVLMNFFGISSYFIYKKEIEEQ